MASVFLFVFFLLSHFVLLLSAQEEKGDIQSCADFLCRKPRTIGFPFANSTNPKCGLFPVDCRDDQYPKIQLGDGGRPYKVLNISQTNTMSSILIFDIEFGEQLKNFDICESLTNLTFPNSSFISFEITTPNQTLFKCKSTLDIHPPTDFTKGRCKGDYNIYYSNSSDRVPHSLSECSIIQLPKSRNPYPDYDDLFALLSPEFELLVHFSEECKPDRTGKLYCVDECYRCQHRGGQCKHGDKGKPYCDEAEKGICLGITQNIWGYTHTSMKCINDISVVLRCLYQFLIHACAGIFSVACHNPLLYIKR
jgi:hypothetical protein